MEKGQVLWNSLGSWLWTVQNPVRLSWGILQFLFQVRVGKRGSDKRQGGERRRGKHVGEGG